MWQFKWMIVGWWREHNLQGIFMTFGASRNETKNGYLRDILRKEISYYFNLNSFYFVISFLFFNKFYFLFFFSFPDLIFNSWYFAIVFIPSVLVFYSFSNITFFISLFPLSSFFLPLFTIIFLTFLYGLTFFFFLPYFLFTIIFSHHCVITFV